MIHLFLLLLMATLPSCAPRIIDWSNPQETASRVQIAYDQFKKVTTITGPNCAPDTREDMLMLRAWKLDSGRTEYQIYISDEYTAPLMRSGSGWRFYSIANDIDGQSLPLVQVSRNVNWCARYSCAYLEIVGITITREYLTSHEASGITVKISGTGGEHVVAISGAYIQAFLQKSA